MDYVSLDRIREVMKDLTVLDGDHKLNFEVDIMDLFENTGPPMKLVTQEHYDELIDDQEFLQALEACGVDNWEGYDDAQEMMEE